mgnify:CR=1 FL=1
MSDKAHGMKSELGAVFAEYRDIILFVLAPALGWFGGQQVQKYRVHDLAKSVEALQGDVKAIRAEVADLHRQDSDDNISAVKSAATLSADMKNVSDAVKRIEAKLETKVDK